MVGIGTCSALSCKCSGLSCAISPYSASANRSCNRCTQLQLCVCVCVCVRARARQVECRERHVMHAHADEISRARTPCAPYTLRPHPAAVPAPHLWRAACAIHLRRHCKPGGTQARHLQHALRCQHSRLVCRAPDKIAGEIDETHTGLCLRQRLHVSRQSSYTHTSEGLPLRAWRLAPGGS